MGSNIEKMAPFFVVVVVAELRDYCLRRKGGGRSYVGSCTYVV